MGYGYRVAEPSSKSKSVRADRSNGMGYGDAEPTPTSKSTRRERTGRGRQERCCSMTHFTPKVEEQRTKRATSVLAKCTALLNGTRCIRETPRVHICPDDASIVVEWYCKEEKWEEGVVPRRCERTNYVKQWIKSRVNYTYNSFMNQNYESHIPLNYSISSNIIKTKSMYFFFPMDPT